MHVIRGVTINFRQARPKVNDRRPFEEEGFTYIVINLGKTAHRGLACHASGLIHADAPVCTTMHRGAFCQFTFQWIDYYGSNKSTGKETSKLHLCVQCRMLVLFFVGERS